ncbi:uncharacterized protein LOC128987061 isoform X1 [Macrosteles quadrilineatus]|uniref:uncharacterized protein LOC128987061 isoform X1 n=1 Tax=Macrosteles quadrilineatus TaxID=74068 RepID=UPI0023E24C3A|nr:uncharacterized protein LOC128987061 isoform X1 [Macrosteles quadrilineatus]
MENTEESQLASYESCKLLALSTYQSASERCENQNILTTIKRKYEGVINSPRTFEYINDLHTLLKVLEKRCELQPTDIHVLEYIYSVLNIKTHNLDYHKTILHDTGKSTHNVHSRGDVPLQATNSNTVPTFHYSNPRQSSSGVIGNGSLDQQRLNKRGDVPLQDTNSNTVPTFHYSPPRQSSSGVIGNGSLDQQRLNTRDGEKVSRPPVKPLNFLDHFGDEDLMAISIPDLFNEIVNQLYKGWMCETDGNMSKRRNSLSSGDQMDKTPIRPILPIVQKGVISITLFVIIFLVVTLVIYNIHEFFVNFNVTFISGVLIYCGLFAIAVLFDGMLLTFYDILLLIKTIQSKGVKWFLLNCLKKTPHVILSWFKNDEIVENPQVHNWEIIGLTIYHFILWLGKNLYYKGTAATLKYCIIKLIRLANKGYKYFIEVEIHTSLSDTSNIYQCLKERNIVTQLANKISMSSKYLFNLFCYLNLLYFFAIPLCSSFLRELFVTVIDFISTVYLILYLSTLETPSLT